MFNVVAAFNSDVKHRDEVRAKFDDLRSSVFDHTDRVLKNSRECIKNLERTDAALQSVEYVLEDIRDISRIGNPLDYSIEELVEKLRLVCVLTEDGHAILRQTRCTDKKRDAEPAEQS